MHPEQPATPGSTNPYQFIMEPPKAPKKSLIPPIGGANPLIMRIATVLGAAVVFLIIAAVVVNLLFSSKSNVEDLVGVTQTETEILRVTAQQIKLSDQITRNAAATATATIGSHLQVWTGVLKDGGRVAGDDEIKLKANTATDTKLSTAAQSNTFDVTFREVLHSQLTAYLAELQTTYDHTTRPAEQKTLQAHFEETKLLIKQFEN